MSDTSLARATSVEIELSRVHDAARNAAIDQFAGAQVEEIMLQVAEKRLAVYEARRKLTLKVFNVTDVNEFAGKLAKNKNAAEKLLSIWGGTFELLKDTDGRPLTDIQTVKDDPDVGEYRIYTYYGRYTRPDGVVTEQQGSFSTKNAFFAKAHDAWKRLEEIDIADVMAAAQSEVFKRCIFRGIGLGEWTEDEGKELKGEAKGHAFSGSTAGVGKKDAIVGFGKAKGTLVSKLEDADLGWYEKSYRENVEDPDKKRWAKQNKEILDAIVAEKARRTAPKPEAAEKAQEAVTPTASAGESVEARPEPAESGRASTPKAGETSPAPASATGKTRGQLISEVYDLLNKASDQKPKNAAATLRHLCLDFDVKETGNISEIPDAMLAKVALMTVDDLKRFQKAAGLV